MYRHHIVVAIFTLLVSNVTLAQDAADCLADAPAIQVLGSSIEVTSEQGNDTGNLQCALDAAVAEGISTIKLVSSEYTVDQVSVTGFSGALSGKSKSGTTLNMAEAGVDCSAADATVLRFYVGAPTVKNMTINVAEVCGSSGEQAAAIGFYSNASDCASRTTFGNVDRVVIQGPGSAATDVLTGIRMTNAAECADKVLGTLKVNRSEIDGLALGVMSSIGGAGQVDVNFNTFTNMGASIAIANANQGSSITGNTISFNQASAYAGFSDFGATGIVVAGDTNSPNSNLTSIKSNTFVNGNEGNSGYAVLVGQEDKKTNHTMWVSNNRFEGQTSSSGTARTPAWNNTVQTAAAPAQAIEYTQDWEGDEAEALSGWLGFINVFGADCASYQRGYQYSALGSAVAVIADGADSKVLNVYNDYDGTAWGEGDVNCLQANVYRQVTIEAENAGDYEFSYIVDPPELAGDNTVGFIRIFSLPSYALENEFTQVSTPGEQTISFTIEESMAGKALQFGFSTTSLRSENSGMQYDNLIFGAADSSGGGDNGGGEPTGEGAGYGIAILDTDGVIVSGNRFVDGAAAWTVVGASSSSSVAGWSIVDNTFSGSTAAADIALAASTADVVVGPAQNTPDVVDDGDNSVLDGNAVSGDTEAMVAAIADHYALLWGLITGD